MKPLRLVIVISGAGSNMLAIANACKSGELNAKVVLVVANRAEAQGLQRANEQGLPTATLIPEPLEPREAFDRRLKDLIDAAQPDLVVLAGYMRILSSEFVASYARRLLNIHPSLLPRHKGLNTHARALEAGDRHHGATVHLVTAELDGGPPLLQGRLQVRIDDSPETLTARVREIEHRIYPETLQLIASSRLSLAASPPELDGQPLVQALTIDFEV